MSSRPLDTEGQPVMDTAFLFLFLPVVGLVMALIIALLLAGIAAGLAEATEKRGELRPPVEPVPEPRISLPSTPRSRAA